MLQTKYYSQPKATAKIPPSSQPRTYVAQIQHSFTYTTHCPTKALPRTYTTLCPPWGQCLTLLALPDLGQTSCKPHPPTNVQPLTQIFDVGPTFSHWSNRYHADLFCSNIALIATSTQSRLDIMQTPPSSQRPAAHWNSRCRAAIQPAVK